MKKKIFEGEEFLISEKVYEPSEDSFLLLEKIKVEGNENFLEIGTGSGIVSIMIALDGCKGVATDISKEAIRIAEKNAEKKGISDQIDFKRGDLFEPVPKKKFDLIIFNSPYLPIKEEEKINEELAKAWNGGPSGRIVIDQFLENFDDYLKDEGIMYLVQSSLSGEEKTIKKIQEKGFNYKKFEKKSFFENILLFKIQKNH